MNRNKLLSLFVSNLANAIIHKVLEKAIDRAEIIDVYDKEVKNSWEIANRYRQKINPVGKPLPLHDQENIRSKVLNKVRSELNILYMIYKRLANHSYRMSEGIDVDDGYWGDSDAMNCRTAESTNLRISKRYENLDLSLVEKLTDDHLRDFEIVEGPLK